MDGPDTTAALASIVVRPARHADVERLLEIHVAAFPDPRPIEVRRRVFLHNRLGGMEHLRVAERAGDVVAHAFLFPVGAWFGGREVAASAIASVGVAVEARSSGVASAVMDALHDEARARGDVLTMLYPFRQGFYARKGYAPVARHRVTSLSPRSIPTGWRSAAPGVVRRAQGRDRAEIARIYRSVAQVSTGFVERPDRAWDADLLDERRQWLVLERDGVLDGYVSLTLSQAESHARVRAEVHELVALDQPARRRLFAAVGALADQVGDVVLALAEDDPLDWAFLDADRDRGGTESVEHAQGVVNTGPMLRLLGAASALLARGYAVDGAIDLAIDGEPPFALEVRDGVPKVSPPGGRPMLGMSANVLASVAFGGLRLEDAARLGWLGSVEASALRVAAPLLRLPAFFTLELF